MRGGGTLISANSKVCTRLSGLYLQPQSNANTALEMRAVKAMMSPNDGGCLFTSVRRGVGRPGAGGGKPCAGMVVDLRYKVAWFDQLAGGGFFVRIDGAIFRLFRSTVEVETEAPLKKSDTVPSAFVGGLPNVGLRFAHRLELGHFFFVG